MSRAYVCEGETHQQRMSMALMLQQVMKQNAFLQRSHGVRCPGCWSRRQAPQQDAPTINLGLGELSQRQQVQGDRGALGRYPVRGRVDPLRTARRDTNGAARDRPTPGAAKTARTSATRPCGANARSCP